MESSPPKVCEENEKIENNKTNSLATTDQQVTAENVDNVERKHTGEKERCLREALDKTVAKCVGRKTVQWLFRKSYPILAEKNPQALDGIHKEYVEKLHESIKNEVATMFEEERISDLLDELEDLESKTDPDYEAWRPTGNPSADLRCFLMSIKRKQKTKLTDLLKEEDSENERLQKMLISRRKQLCKLQAKCKEKVEQLNMTTSDLPRLDGENFLAEIKASNINNLDSMDMDMS